MKTIAEETQQLSARVDAKDIEKIDQIRKELRKVTGIEPQRSAAVRMLLHLGFEAYEKQKAKKAGTAAEKEKKA